MRFRNISHRFDGVQKLLQIPKIIDSRGNLSFIQKGDYCPFVPKRIFWTYNVPSGSVRGGHAYRKQSEFIVAINGSFVVVIKDQHGDEHRFRLERGDQGLLLPPLTWRWMEGFSTNGTGLHLSDMEFDIDDYVRSYSEYTVMK